MVNPQMVMYEEEFNQIQSVVDRLVREANAKVVFIVDKNGQLIAASGDVENIDTTSLASLTAGNIAEVTELSHFDLAKGDIVVMDRGYIDYKRLYRIELGGATFVTRMKEGCRYQPLSLKVFPKGSAVQIDARIRLSSIRGSRNYPRDLREVVYHDTVHNRDYVFLTNNFDLSAQEIADVYKARWQVELFFKWIKQNLKIKTFWGTSRNAVYTQIWVALIVFMLIWINKALSGLSSSPQRILQILKTTILGTGSLSSLFFPPPPPDIPDPSQLLLGGFKY